MKGDAGDILYFQIAEGILCACKESEFGHFSWPRLQKGFTALEKQYGTSMISVNSFALMKVWTEANSWGALRWRVVIVRKGQARAAFEDADGVGFTKNIPVSETIAGGSYIERHLNVNGEYWSTAKDGKIRFESGDQLIVIYEVPPENEAKQMHVRYGFVPLPRRRG